MQDEIPFPFEATDWNDYWINAQRKSRTSGRARECWETWDDLQSARDYFNRVSTQDETSRRAADLLSMIDENALVLDIGAGPGNLSIPLAQKAHRVTAVEPAAGMATVLAENMKIKTITNIDIVRKRWDDVDPITDLLDGYDLVIASYSFGMLNLLESIRKMIAIAKKHVVFYWHAGPQAWDHDAKVLWPLLHDKTFSPIPKSDVIFNLLYSMGIYPEVHSIPASFSISFETIEDAQAAYQKRFDVDEHDTKKNALLSSYLEHSLLLQDGKYTQKARNTGMRISFNIEHFKHTSNNQGVF